MKYGLFKRIINLIVLVAFVCLQTAWAGSLSQTEYRLCTQKLAAQCQLGQLGRLPLTNLEQLLHTNQLMRELGIKSFADVVSRMTDLEERGVMCFARTDSQCRVARYVFLGSGAFMRMTGVGEEVNDDVSQLLQDAGILEKIGY